MNNPVLVDQDEFFMSMAVFSAFIDKGMRACPQFPALATSGCGERELVDGIANLVPLAVRLERAILAADVACVRSDGLLEQDVCELFGAWYVRHCSENGVANLEGCRNHLADAIIAYFAEGQTPLDTWTIILAVKAEEPALKLRHPALADSINWEWAPRLAVNGDMRSREEHPQHPRSTWTLQGGPAHISEYWPWVQHRVREAYVRSRYDVLAGTPDIFMDLIGAEQLLVEGCRLNDLLIRCDLVGQEVIESLPARTVFSVGLFAALPGLYKAVLAMHPEFDLEVWIGLPISNFMSEYGREADPDLTAIVSGMAWQDGEGHSFTLTLAILWDAVPDENGGWRFEDGTMLSFIAAGIRGTVHGLAEEVASP